MPNKNRFIDEGSANVPRPDAPGSIRPTRRGRSAVEEAFWQSLDDGGSFAFDGRRIDVRQLGDGPAVLLLHGNGGRGSQFIALMAALAGGGMRAVTLDLPGFGEQGPDSLTVDDIAQAMLHVGTGTGAGPDGWHGIVAHSLANSWALYAAALGLGCERYVSVGSIFDAALCDELLGVLIGIKGIALPGAPRLAWCGGPPGAPTPQQPCSADWPPLGRSALIVQAVDYNVPIEHDVFAAAAGWALRWPGSAYLAIGGCSNDGVLTSSAFIDRTKRFLDPLPSAPINTSGLF